MSSIKLIWALSAALTFQPLTVLAEQSLGAERIITEQVQPLQLNLKTNVKHEAYILGAGDSIRVEVLDLPELSGIFSIGPDGIIYIPRLRGLLVENLTIEELRLFLTEQFKNFVLQPEIFVTPIHFRPVRVYVGGEVARPGFYTISSSEKSHDTNLNNQQKQPAISNSDASSARSFVPEINLYTQEQASLTPTLFDALQAARGVTPFSQLAKIQVTRRRPQSQGGGKIRTQVNFLRMIRNGDEDVNIRLYDGDSVFVHKSDHVLRDQLLAASRTNLSPNFVEVFVSGRVKEPGPKQLPQGSSLNQAIASAGGPKLLRGRVEFLRFNQEGATDRRIFRYDPNSASGEYRNPVLMPGDVVRVNESIASASLEFLNEITAPAVGVYSVYSIYKDFE